MMRSLRSIWVLSISWLILVTCSHVLAQSTPQPRIRPTRGQRQVQSGGQVRGPVGAPNETQAPATGRILDAQAQPQLQPAARQVGPPPEFQLSPAQQQRLDQMLDYWQSKTSSIQTLSAQFGRWVYDPVFGPKDAKQAAKFSIGEIRYAAVDKGMIREDKVYEYDSAKKGQDKPFTLSKELGEHWVCTGTSVFEYDHHAKKLNEIKLPQSMQGNAIAEGPLPFMFGAKAEAIKKRYWIREIPQKSVGAPYHLEFLPKHAGESYSRIQIKLDAKKFLPTEMVLYELNKMGYSAYAFRNMEENSPKHKIGDFLNRFIAPTVPRGYTLVVHDPPVEGAPQQAQGQQPERR